MEDNRDMDPDARLARELSSGQMTQAEVDDLLEQKAKFDSNRQAIERDHQGHAVGYVAGQMLVADSVPELVERAKADYPGRMAYVEGVGYDPFGGAAL